MLSLVDSDVHPARVRRCRDDEGGRLRTVAGHRTDGRNCHVLAYA
ncbi:hypothetical protein ODI_R1207 [Orrella dioscoreae]|uniref:Uncharacterized protein n=1 Tax=Orrella dioscoreae TaxID=1851544 RepID=A0A1C3K7Q9_9BURK|nr:hypothetical protein ODI_02473 [Orrella dioscoreae]SOE48058.1 hypothetical protein ODI_R1207 [Orrella dioscoreae]